MCKFEILMLELLKCREKMFSIRYLSNNMKTTPPPLIPKILDTPLALDQRCLNKSDAIASRDRKTYTLFVVVLPSKNVTQSVNGYIPTCIFYDMGYIYACAHNKEARYRRTRKFNRCIIIAREKYCTYDV